VVGVGGGWAGGGWGEVELRHCKERLVECRGCENWHYGSCWVVEVAAERRLCGAASAVCFGVDVVGCMPAAFPVESQVHTLLGVGGLCATDSATLSFSRDHSFYAVEISPRRVDKTRMGEAMNITNTLHKDAEAS
jgi:hypothetical protein